MAPSPEDLSATRKELTNAKAGRLINFIKSNKEDDPDRILARRIEKLIHYGQPNWEGSLALKQIYKSMLNQTRDQAQDHEDRYEAFVPQQELDFEEIEGSTMLSKEAQKKLEFVIDYLKQGNNFSDAIQELAGQLTN
ncbi:hypothetical protein DSO57_1017383 [Entomophthora muscae]|uniref:Uncharacterized protein n=1 Tax=Entomophthora muscae TaxID=34485 RepID=A0ACC2U2Z9_9FUNG|nr:hypothetical protein DSO57_1017383 [Entomophthora muscae]